MPPAIPMKTVLLASNSVNPTVTFLERILAERKVEVIQARNGMEALERLEARRPDVVVLDEKFSHRDWFSQILKNDPDTASIPVLILPESAHLWRIRHLPPPPTGQLIPVPAGPGPRLDPQFLESLLSEPAEEDPDPGTAPNERVHEMRKFLRRLFLELKLIEVREKRRRANQRP
jgi:hypothetical protein